jgi:glycerol-3-phosphate acyltransferase PlsY
MSPYLIYGLIGYIAGSCPTGVVLGRFVGRDPRLHGSGNIGASNVTRTLGKKWGLITLVVDALKGAIPTFVALRCTEFDVALLTGFLAVFGHCFPIWLRFRGGKGVATAFGAVVVIVPVVAVVAAMIWITIVYLTRVPTFGSLTAAALFVALPHVEPHPFTLHLFTLALALLILIRHSKNLGVLRKRRAQEKAKKQRRRH